MTVLAFHPQDILGIAAVLLVWAGFTAYRRRRRRPPP